MKVEGRVKWWVILGGLYSLALAWDSWRSFDPVALVLSCMLPFVLGLLYAVQRQGYVQIADMVVNLHQGSRGRLCHISALVVLMVTTQHP